MIIDKNSLFFHFVSSVGSHRMPTDICGLTRRFILAIFFWGFFCSAAIFLVGAFLYLTAQTGGEFLAALVTGFYDKETILTMVVFFIMLFLWTAMIGLYLYERYKLNIVSPFVKMIDKINKNKEEKQDSVYFAMVKSYFGKFCIRVEYKE